MMAQVLASDFSKIRRTAIWFLVFLGPVGVIALQAVNFGLRYDYLTDLYAADLWAGVLMNVQFLVTPTIILGITIITSMIASIEHQMNSWKQLLALPITKSSVFTAKFALSVILLLISCTLLALGTAGLGVALKCGSDIPVLELIKQSFYPLFTFLPVLALQLWLAITLRNQAIPLTIGIIGTILSLYAFSLSQWIVSKWPLLVNETNVREYSVLAGIVVGLCIFSMGLFDFLRRDVN
ncbi:ABC transporter permease [Paenibacillus sp. IHBB 10380]|uniref:ABC transporter permease n=1 Tax=Paenibacillus sp. IHBB 10380 TaxID=1566358 RepID=UPI0005CFAF4C|nr:ABC transporter permease [Paenibacillus sp. IHBB 10380]AJS58134.1 permease [Paenibacillus sp. IHBB 10380]